ncbi:MAG: DUF2085 domain-containing protein [Coriobacteriales bacterium]|nr:DUF2085 domain-containing protein [Coriobacteriales bacterium]
MQDILHFFGHGFCHQLPERSFEAGGLIFSVCARDTGIYLGFFCALLAAFILYARDGRKPSELAPVPYLIVLALFVLPMAFDGASSYLGLRPTTNTIRYITGFLVGTSAASLLAPLLFALRKDADPSKRIFARPFQALAHLAMSFLLGAAFLVGYPFLGPSAPVLALVAFLSIPFSVNLLLVKLSKRLAVRHDLRGWLFVVVLVCLLSFIEIAAFGALRDFIAIFFFNGQDISSIWMLGQSF